ncbi:hypothetical protein JIR001_16810 [Polycladomyces abyssicola]|uniref:YetF C-terminal domain-containing protein n=1 Tax=Polycladomyces abyssicola TaxID=1125966 RepID=A0A8D5UFT1_9BACL|nr:hypothetical protein JIR001_16810 [Polycladomyces abyssicola]
METNGEINVLLKKENQPITPKHLGIKVSPEQAPQAVIMDGKILDEPLTVLGLNRKWLHTELEKLGVAPGVFKLADEKKKKLTPVQQEYQQLAKSKEPPRPIFKNCFRAFIAGGTICLVEQGQRSNFPLSLHCSSSQRDNRIEKDTRADDVATIL